MARGPETGHSLVCGITGSKHSWCSGNHLPAHGRQEKSLVTNFVQ